MTLLTRRSFLLASAAVPAGFALIDTTPTNASDGFMELRAKLEPTHLGSNKQMLSPLWLYNGELPGPEIRVKKGDRVRVRFVNELDEPSSIHWHGIRIDNVMDGVPGLTQNPVLPGESFDYDFIVPDAGTYWYHAHNHSWAQVGRGLYGPLIVEEDDSSIIKDITLMIDDWRLGPDGVLLTDFDNYMQEKHFGRIGNYVTVNGQPMGQTVKVRADYPCRLRLVNASNARVLRLRTRKMHARAIAFDGQNLAMPESGDEMIVIAPAQRVDLIFRPIPGETGLIEDADGTLSHDRKGGEKAALIQFQTGDRGGPEASELTLPPSDLTQPSLQYAVHVPLMMEGGSLSSIGPAVYAGEQLGVGQLAEAKQVWKFNGIANLPEKPLFSVEKGRTVVINMDNRTGFEHAMHIHGHHFMEVPPNSETGPWRDTILMAARSEKSIVFVADNPGKWLFHCHMLEHAAAGMRTWFEVA